MTALLLLLKPVGRPIENYLVAFLIVVATFSYINMLINIIENRDLYKNSSALDINNNKNLSIYKRYILMIYFYIIGVLSYTMLSYLILYFPLGCSLEQRADLVKNAAYTLIPGGKSILNVENTRGVLLDFSGFVYKLIFTTSFIGLISRISLSDLVSKNDNEVIININKKDDELNNSKPETKEPLLNTNMPVTLPKKENSKRPRKRKKRKRK
ncbi:MAG TPA: hypothetical protein DCM73_03230 [Clostridiales bacterium]|nr:hypothetical protein [Clostridiales bacterium]